MNIEATIKPNIFIIGAMKAGTTSLHNYLNNHPAVFMCEPKELGYFDERGGWYLDIFRDAGSIVVESRKHYIKLPLYQNMA